MEYESYIPVQIPQLIMHVIFEVSLNCQEDFIEFCHLCDNSLHSMPELIMNNELVLLWSCAMGVFDIP